MWGTRRLDYILVDPGLKQVIERIGYLGTHKGAETDHVYAYMDLNDKIANQGIVHRPITTKSRDFVLAQSEKVQKFLDELVPSAKRENYKTRVTKLAKSFSKHGPTHNNVRVYQQIYNSFLELAGATTASMVKRRFGYERLQELTTKGQLLLIHKNILDCKNLHAPLTPSILKRAEIIHVNPMSIIAHLTIEI